MKRKQKQTKTTGASLCDELKVCFIHTSNDFSELGASEMQKHNKSASNYGIIDVSEFSKLKVEIKQDKSYSLRTLQVNGGGGGGGGGGRWGGGK